MDSLLHSSNILIRGLNWIGDAVMSLPTIWHLGEALPEASITVLSRGWCSDIYRICPAVDVVIEPGLSGRRKSVFSEFALARLIKDKGFDSAIILPNSFRSALAPFIANIPQRFGYKTDGRTILLTEGLKPRKDSREHMVLYYKALLEMLAIEWKDGHEKFGMAISEQIQSEADEILKKRGVDVDGELIGFSPGAAWGPSKRWPQEHFAETARLVCENGQRQALFFGSRGDAELIESITASAQIKCVSLAGAFEQLRHLVATIRRCKVLITNDSGPMHIAAAVGVPVVAMFGPTDEKISGPWTGKTGKATILRAPECEPCYNPRCKGNGNPCLARIPARDVVAAAEELLNRK